MRCALLLLLLIALVGCGSGSSSTDDACIITFVGNQLCGDAGKAWCERFADRINADETTVSACRAVGADIAIDDAGTHPLDDIAERVREVLDRKYVTLSPSVDVDGRTVTIVLVPEEMGTPATKAERRRVCASARAAALNQAVPITVGDVNSSEDVTDCA